MHKYVYTNYLRRFASTEALHVELDWCPLILYRCKMDLMELDIMLQSQSFWPEKHSFYV